MIDRTLPVELVHGPVRDQVPHRRRHRLVVRIRTAITVAEAAGFSPDTLALSPANAGGERRGDQLAAHAGGAERDHDVDQVDAAAALGAAG